MTGFRPRKGRFVIEWYPKTASEAFAKYDLVYSASGYLTKADATSGDHIGVILKTVAATDDDYASNTFVPVLVPMNPNAEWEVPVGTGTLTAAMVNEKYDLKDANEIDVSATSKKVVTITRFISSSVAWVKINAMIGYGNVATT